MPSVRFPVEAGHIMLFARAIDDPNPRFGVMDDAARGVDVVAPPTFAMASAQFDPNYALRPKHGQPWIGSGREPSGTTRVATSDGAPVLHAEQHFTYHRPIRSGMVLHVDTRPGKTWEKQSRSGGRLLFHELVAEYRDADGTLVVTACLVGVRQVAAEAVQR